MNVLLIDDERPIGVLLNDWLKNFYADLLFTQEESCTDGIKTLKESKWDIVLLDYRLATQSGLDCLRTLRKEFPDLPVVMLTGDMSDQVMVECMQAGADDFVRKDLIIQMLYHVLQSATQRRRAFRRIAADTAIRKADLDRIGKR